MSGDGPNNIGTAGAAGARASAVAGHHHQRACRSRWSAAAATRSACRDLAAYYRDCVVGGPGAFTLTVTAIDQFEIAIRRKLIQEIATAAARTVQTADEEADATSDCLIGEKLRGRRDYNYDAPSGQ